MQNETDLSGLFSKFSAGESTIENKSFNKIFKDSGLIGGSRLSLTDLDIIFAKNKKKEERKMQIPQFKNAFTDVAAKLKITPSELLNKCAAGPIFKGTKTDKVPLHDDKSLYTGVYANGGPTTVDKGKGYISDLSELANRKDADVRGVNKTSKQ